MDSVLNKMPKSLNSILGKPDSPASKVSFVLVLLVIIYILTKVILYILTQYYSNMSKETVILSGRLTGSEYVKIKTSGPDSVDSEEVEDNTIEINRSINESNGIEFTYTMWLNTKIGPVSTIDVSCTFNNDESHTIHSNCLDSSSSVIHIFSKGDDTIYNGAALGKLLNINCPGVYLGYYEDENSTISSNLYIITDTDGAQASGVTNNNNIIVINWLPHEKWFHLTISVKQNIIYIYINGTLITSKKMEGIITQNNNDYHINNNANTDYGSIADIFYYSKALNIFEINSKANKAISTNKSERSRTNSDTNNIVSFNYDWIHR